MLEFDAAWKAELDKVIIMLPDVRGVGKRVLDACGRGVKAVGGGSVRTPGSSGGLPFGGEATHASCHLKKPRPFLSNAPSLCTTAQSSDAWWEAATESANQHQDLKFILGVPNSDGEVRRSCGNRPPVCPILGPFLCICTVYTICGHHVQSTQSLMRMLGVVRADLPALMAIEHHSQAKFLARRADSSELEDFVLRYKVDGGRAHYLMCITWGKNLAAVHV